MEQEQTPKQVQPEDTKTISIEEQDAKREFNNRLPRESSSSPLKGTQGKGSSGSGSPAGLGFGASQAGATEGAVRSVVSFVTIIFSCALQE